MKRKDNNLGDLHLSDGDIKAILSALPLVTLVEADTPTQTLRNDVACRSAGEKLLTRGKAITSEEIRIISVAINMALLVISGQTGDYIPDVDPEWRAELSGYFFILNRLDPIFQRLVDEILSRQ